MRAGVEIVIGNMCLRQTNQKKVCVMRGLLCVCARLICVKLQKTSEDTDTDAFSSLQMPSFNWPFVSSVDPSRFRVIVELRRPKPKKILAFSPNKWRSAYGFVSTPTADLFTSPRLRSRALGLSRRPTVWVKHEKQKRINRLFFFSLFCTNSLALVQRCLQRAPPCQNKDEPGPIVKEMAAMGGP